MYVLARHYDLDDYPNIVIALSSCLHIKVLVLNQIELNKL